MQLNTTFPKRNYFCGWAGGKSRLSQENGDDNNGGKQMMVHKLESALMNTFIRYGERGRELEP